MGEFARWSLPPDLSIGRVHQDTPLAQLALKLGQGILEAAHNRHARRAVPCHDNARRDVTAADGASAAAEVPV